MRIGRSLLLIAALCLPGIAAAQPADTAAELQNQATFCEGTYALCIKAACTAIPTLDRLGNYATDRALCSCDVVKGWSMGPGACVDRAPVQQKGRTYLISTYSNLYNSSHRTLSCEQRDTRWAWCYGAPCVVDEKDPSKAVCTCPVEQGPAKTLGGDCRQDACSGIWSAASPAGDAFANNHFYRTMRRDHPDVPVNEPAPACLR
jgi:hypothetical protein